MQQAVYTAGKVLQFGLPLLWLLAVERCYPAGRFAETWNPRFSIAVGAVFGLLVATAILAGCFGVVCVIGRLGFSAVKTRYAEMLWLSACENSSVIRGRGDLRAGPLAGWRIPSAVVRFRPTRRLLPLGGQPAGQFGLLGGPSLDCAGRLFRCVFADLLLDDLCRGRGRGHLARPTITVAARCWGPGSESCVRANAAMLAVGAVVPAFQLDPRLGVHDDQGVGPARFAAGFSTRTT